MTPVTPSRQVSKAATTRQAQNGFHLATASQKLTRDLAKLLKGSGMRVDAKDQRQQIFPYNGNRAIIF